MDLQSRQDIEIGLFMQALRLRHGYDFAGYARASFNRRVRALAEASGAASISALTERLIHDEPFLAEVIGRLSVPVSEMFRNPPVFDLLRREVLPVLASYPQINIWQAGCAHGEEAYSMAILLKEAGLYARARIYATDISELALERARAGIYPLREAQLFSSNYLQAGGSGSLSDWYTAAYQHIKLDQALAERITFANHNLAADGVFGEMHLILCRNVLIYFGEPLQQRALALFRDSLVRGGFLCLGDRERPSEPRFAQDFGAIAPGASVFRRVTAR
ncbi:MAG: Chemotaxis protein methyltransferase CheR [Hydrocarboniphaga sp.]|uniref:CheR family methyltransferase n=1 Tax=Hydrocarboniphaga sp. TaxID=2033016 RepID=UPI0026160367|nr:protein-glutamate O-methyltransferase CheR [Hydrocarboniphaga sp.]MDB5969418.1 Chemotaxis protein methyltransferase CheR [Hydrocarboniphaga sp.]